MLNHYKRAIKSKLGELKAICKYLSKIGDKDKLKKYQEQYKLISNIEECANFLENQNLD